ncbi:sugar phosphate nucleotidyltransferase [Clostridium cagae]|uniref:phosphocholine cytidylyltransferase family protein n=1 Tax=Clostridium cagae TaxID=2080751 RepID=UPI003F76ED60
MRIIILAAGVGSRLRPLTQNVPKSLLKVANNITVLEYTINMINANCNCEIIVVTGFNKDKFIEPLKGFENCTIVENPFFRVSNSIASLWFAREYMVEETIVINSDVIIEDKLFKKILETKNYATVFYDSSIGEHADYKVVEKDGRVVVMSKELNDFSGEYIGITKFSLKASSELKDKVENMICSELINEWYETALVDMIYNDNLKLTAIDVSEYKWTEIDNVNDLIKAKEIIEPIDIK